MANMNILTQVIDQYISTNGMQRLQEIMFNILSVTPSIPVGTVFTLQDVSDAAYYFSEKYLYGGTTKDWYNTMVDYLCFNGFIPSLKWTSDLATNAPPPETIVTPPITPVITLPPGTTVPVITPGETTIPPGIEPFKISTKMLLIGGAILLFLFMSGEKKPEV